MLRYETKYFGGDLEKFVRDHVVTVERCNHRRASRLVAQGGRIALTQEFREGEYCCKSAVAVSIVGRPATARYVNETDVVLETGGGGRTYTMLIATAASFDPGGDVLAEAFAAVGCGGEGRVRLRSRRRAGNGGTTSGRAATFT